MLSLLDTPSSGVDETLQALAQAHAYHGRFVDLNHIKRQLPKVVALDDISEVLTSLESQTFVQDNGSGGFSLTDAGLVFHRQHRVRRSRIDINVT